MKNLRAFILVLLGVGLAMTIFAPPRFVDLEALRQQNEQLDQVLIQAQEGQRDNMQRWLVQETPAVRRGLAVALLQRLSDETIIADDRLLYEHRHWLIPFVDISTGDESIDAHMDNGLAYALSAGTRNHSDEDIALMSKLLGPLTAVTESLDESQKATKAIFWDTIGCLHFVLGDRKMAVNAFQQAQQVLSTFEDDNEIMMSLRRIVTERSKAAMDANALLPTIWGHEGQLTIEGEAIEWVNPDNVDQATDEPVGEVSGEAELDDSLRQ